MHVRFFLLTHLEKKPNSQNNACNVIKRLHNAVPSRLLPASASLILSFMFIYVRHRHCLIGAAPLLLPLIGALGSDHDNVEY